MIALLLFAVAAIAVVLTILGYIPVLVALPAIGVVVAVLIGYSMRRQGAGPPS